MKENWEDKFWMHGGLTEEEWNELVGLEYVLTHYPKHPDADEKRHKFLSDKKWAGLDALAKSKS